MTDTNLTIPDYPFGGHAFVWARPKDEKWSEVDRTNGLGDGEHEFRPCMVVGQDTGRRIMVLGSQYAHEVGRFEIAGACTMPTMFHPYATRAESAEEPVTSYESEKGVEGVAAFHPISAEAWNSIDDDLDPLTLHLRDVARNFLENNGYKVIVSQASEDRFSINGEPEIDGEALIDMALSLGFSPSGWGR